MKRRKQKRTIRPIWIILHPVKELTPFNNKQPLYTWQVFYPPITPNTFKMLQPLKAPKFKSFPVMALHLWQISCCWPPSFKGCFLKTEITKKNIWPISLFLVCPHTYKENKWNQRVFICPVKNKTNKNLFFHVKIFNLPRLARKVGKKKKRTLETIASPR